MGASEVAKVFQQDLLAPMDFADGEATMFEDEGVQPDYRIVMSLAMQCSVPLTALTTKAMIAVRDLTIVIKYAKVTIPTGETRHVVNFASFPDEGLSHRKSGATVTTTSSPRSFRRYFLRRLWENSSSISRRCSAR